MAFFENGRRALFAGVSGLSLIGGNAYGNCQFDFERDSSPGKAVQQASQYAFRTAPTQCTDKGCDYVHRTNFNGEERISIGVRDANKNKQLDEGEVVAIEYKYYTGERNSQGVPFITSISTYVQLKGQTMAGSRDNRPPLKWEWDLEMIRRDYEHQGPAIHKRAIEMFYVLLEEKACKELSQGLSGIERMIKVLSPPNR